MKLLSSLSFLVRVVLVGALAGPALMVTPARGQAAAATLDQQDFEHAGQAVDQNKLEEAAGLYEGIPVKYPTSALIPSASVRLGYVYFRLQQYDKAVKTLQATAVLKTVTPEIAELALSLVPQALAAKAISEGPKSPQRKRLFEEAIKGYDTFLQQFPKSDEVEGANYGKAVAHYQIEQYDDAIKSLRINLTDARFQKSESILDSQYLMALTMATVANSGAQAGTLSEEKVAEQYKNAELMLTDIVNKGTDVALANESRFQIGELLYSHAGFLKDKEAQKALYLRAMDTYRVVAGKEPMVAAQKARIERYKAMRVPAMQQRDAALLKRIGRAVEREQEKLANIEGRADPTLVAKVKVGQVFFQLDRLDECRVVLGYVKPLIDDEEQKKAIAYFYALSLARQNADTRASIAPLAEQSEKVYAEFIAAYGADPIGENLPLILGAGFTESDPPKALKYFEDLRKNFPNSKLLITSDMLALTSLIKEGKYDQALKVVAGALASNPSKEVAAAMKFGKATVLQKQKKLSEALPVFKDVRDNYPGTEQAIQASFFYPQLLLENGDFKAALPELQAFVKNNPKNQLLPTALYFLARAQVGNAKSDDALATFKRLAEEFPQADTAPFSYFERAQILMQKEQPDAVVKLMQQFMDKYPDAPTLFQAYDFVAQIQISRQAKKEEGADAPDASKKDMGKVEAIDTYEKFASRKPADPMSAQALLRAAVLWKEVTESLGRYVLVKEEDRPEWQKRVANSMKDAEEVVRKYPESSQVALALALLLDDQKMLVSAKLKTDPDVEAYFDKLADEFKDKPATRSKIIFTLAGNLIEKDKAKALGLMEKVYDPALKYAPDDMDLYGTGLIDQKKLDEAVKVFTKLGADYPIPAGKEPAQAPRDIQEAQSMMLFGLGKVLQEQGKVAEAKVYFDDLEKNYGWSPKMLAAHIGIAEALYKEKKYDESLKRCLKVTGAGKAPPELRARAMFVLSQNHEALEHFDDAINNYVKISAMYASVPKYAAEGLFRGAQLLERQARGEIPIPTPPPKPTPQKKGAPGAKGSPAAPAPAPAEAPAAATAAK
jgi:TolA-binding protein